MTENNKDIKDIDVDMLKARLEENFSIASILEVRTQKFDENFSNSQIQDLIVEDLNKNLSRQESHYKINDDTWVELDPDDPILESISGGAANVNVLSNVNVAVTVNAAIYLNVAAAIYAAAVVLVALAGHSPNAGFCCFPKGTRVKKADGTKEFIEDILPGEKLLGYDSSENRVERRVICDLKKGDKVYSINGQVECTWEQLFLSTDGFWLAVDIQGYKLYRDIKRISNPEFGLNDEDLRQMVVGDKVKTQHNSVDIKSISVREVIEPEVLYSFELDGNKTFYANNYTVEGKSIS